MFDLSGGAMAFGLARWRGSQRYEEVWTREELAYAIARAAEGIRLRTRPGDRVIVAHPPGLSFIAGFLGCLAAERIGVPAQAPTTARARAAIAAAAADAQASLLLTSNKDSVGLGLPVLDLDESPARGAMALRIDVDPERVAYLQYTSGSTGAPRGAVIRFGALAANIRAIRDTWDLGPADCGVFWLPPFHDMGLVGGILAPLAIGFPSWLMHPSAFLQRPIRWLQLIAEKGATFSGGPNFAYEHCVAYTDPCEVAALDLTAWRVAVNGAEPVRAETLGRVAALLAPACFGPEALCPGYGLAESVLFVTGRRPSEPSALEARPRPLCEHIGCGRPATGTTLRIVDPDSGEPMPPGAQGEIWVHGPSLARGYWPSKCQGFVSRDGKTWLRTGDLGFLDEDGELFVCGRLKDVIIQAGRKANAVDIERAAAQAAGLGAALRNAAVAVEAGGRERCILLQEVPPERAHAGLASVLSAAIGAACDIVIDQIVFVRAGALPVTSSGKIARAAARAAFVTGALPAALPLIGADRAASPEGVAA